VTGYVIASVLFLLGSVFSCPACSKEAWGAWGFIIGSALFAVGAVISVTQITEASMLICLQLLNAVAICFVIGSILFLIPSIPYLWSVDESNLTQNCLPTWPLNSFSPAYCSSLEGGQLLSRLSNALLSGFQRQL